MSWSLFVEWLAMGKYGAHIWSAYAFSLLVLGGMVAHAILRKNKTLDSLAKRRQ